MAPCISLLNKSVDVLVEDPDIIGTYVSTTYFLIDISATKIKIVLKIRGRLGKSYYGERIFFNLLSDHNFLQDFHTFINQCLPFNSFNRGGSLLMFRAFSNIHTSIREKLKSTKTISSFHAFNFMLR